MTSRTPVEYPLPSAPHYDLYLDHEPQSTISSITIAPTLSAGELQGLDAYYSKEEGLRSVPKLDGKHLRDAAFFQSPFGRNAFLHAIISLETPEGATVMGFCEDDLTDPALFAAMSRKNGLAPEVNRLHFIGDRVGSYIVKRTTATVQVRSVWQSYSCK